MPMGKKRRTLTADEERLLKAFAQLSATQRETLQSFAEFLVSQADNSPEESGPPAEPQPIPRPASETVVAAIKRLNATYFMLEDRSGLLNESSALMTQHVMQGRDLCEVIDELEALFARFYDEWRAEQST